MTKIDKPGIYDISMAEYHGDPCIGHSVSGSGLVTIEQQSLAHYWWSSPLNPARPADEPTPALVFGQAFHCLVLEGLTAFAARYAVKPADMNFSTKEGKAWRADHAGREIIPQEWADRAEAMRAAILRHPLCARAFVNGLPERSLIWRDAETGLWLKSRPDWLPNAPAPVPNLKSAASLQPETWERQAINLGYHQSAALSADALAAVLGWPSPTAYFIVQEKEPPYVTAPVVIDDDVIAWGRMINRRALHKLARAVETNQWPAYTDGVMVVRMPVWAEKKLEARHASGEFSEVDPARQGPIEGAGT